MGKTVLFGDRLRTPDLSSRNGEGDTHLCGVDWYRIVVEVETSR
jgi:hypothetical protein